MKAGTAAVRKLLKHRGVSLDEIMAFEIMENSAEDVLSAAAELGIEEDKINPLGGALAFGKNDGAEGLLMLQRLAMALKKDELGLICSYTAGGMGMAALIRGC